VPPPRARRGPRGGPAPAPSRPASPTAASPQPPGAVATAPPAEGPAGARPTAAPEPDAEEPEPARRRRRARAREATRVVALDGVSLDVPSGEIFGLLGPNGAGKTTMVGILTTRVRPTEGRAWIGEDDVWRDPVRVKRHIGVVPQRPNLDFQLTAREILLFHGAYFGMSGKDRARRADELLERFQLTGRGGDLVTGYSGGMQQRLSLARAIMHEPEVLFLDEPSAGLDPQTRLLLWEIVREYNAAARTVILTTHYMDEADTLCDRIAIIDHGRVIQQGTPGPSRPPSPAATSSSSASTGIRPGCRRCSRRSPA